MFIRIFTEVVENPEVVLNIWERLWNFVELNFPSVIGWSVTAFGMAIGLLYLIKISVPKLLGQLGTYLAKLMVGLLGGDFESVAKGADKLPFIQSIEKQSKEWLLEQETRLVEIKGKLVSNKLNQLEREVLTKQYDLLIEAVGGRISESTAEFLKELNKKDGV